MTQFKGKFRVIVNMIIPEARTKEQAERIGREMARKIFNEQPDWDYIELASVEEIDNENPVPRH